MNQTIQPPVAQDLTPFTFFEGNVSFSGFVQDLTGKVRRHYNGTIACTQSDTELVLDETLFFNDGAREERIWRMVRDGAGISGSANDLVGRARVQSHGPDEMRWHYTMEVEIGGKRRPFNFTDVFVQTDNDTLISKTTMSKFGLPLARLYSTYRRLPAQG